jgi:hypothetical protein
VRRTTRWWTAGDPAWPGAAGTRSRAGLGGVG